MGLHIVILAAGSGTRMNSDTPKLLHRIGGMPMLERIYDTAQSINPEKIHIVCGKLGGVVATELAHLDANWVEQQEQLGTGHAVAQALPHISDDAMVLVLVGDAPLISDGTLSRLYAATADKQLGLLTAFVNNPFGLGRVLRGSQSQLERIIEEKDATYEQRKINEIYSGILVAPAKKLKQWLPNLSSKNAEAEYYLTDIVGMSVEENYPVVSVAAISPEEVQGVNNRAQLARLERHYQFAQAEKLMMAGITIADPNRFDLRGTLKAGKDVFIDVNAVIEGNVSLGDHVHIGPNVVLRNCKIAAGTTVHEFSSVDSSRIGKNCSIGPYARLRPDNQLADEVRIGNFVELKKSTIASKSKINHLSYVGDAQVGTNVNIGAGTITCNYDGAHKHQTVIGNDVFIGSDTQIIAPVTIGDAATIGAGSTITKDTPPDALTLSRVEQKTVEGWKRPKKSEGH